MRHRRAFFAVFSACVLAGTFFLPSIRFDNSIEVWFLDEDPAISEYREFKKTYGSDEVIVALVDAGPGGIFQPDFLNRFRNVTLQAEKLEGVKRVTSIGKMDYIGLRNGSEFVVEDLFPRQVSDASEASELRDRFLDMPRWRNRLADSGLRRAILLVEPLHDKLQERRPKLIAEVRECLDRERLNFRLAGMGVMYDRLNRISFRDSLIFATLSYVLLLTIVQVFFRCRQLTVTVAAVMVFSSLAFLDVFGWFGGRFDIVTIVLPTLVMILSIADVNHIFNRFCLNEKALRADREVGLTAVIAEILAPSLFTSVTESIGFASTMFTPIGVFHTFGGFAAFAALAEFAIVMSTVPFLLGHLDPETNFRVHQPFTGLNLNILAGVKRRPGIFVFATVSVILISGWGASLVRIDTYTMGYLLPDDPVRMDSEGIEREFGHYLPIEILLDTGRPLGMQEADILRRLRASETAIEALPFASRCRSLTEVVERMNQIWTDGATQSLEIPASQERIAQSMMLYEGDPDNDLSYLVTDGYRQGRLTVHIPMRSALHLADYRDRIAGILEREFAGSGVNIRFSGYIPLYIRLIDYITRSQAVSFGASLLYIFLVIGLLFRRFSALMWGILPNVTPVLMILGFMGFTGIRLDLATVIIAPITLGIAVDDTIHELFHYYAFLGEGLSREHAIHRCLEDEGPAVISTSLILSLGFSVFAFAHVLSVIYFGGLVALTMIFAFLAELIMLPAMIGLVDRWTKMVPHY